MVRQLFVLLCTLLVVIATPARDYASTEQNHKRLRHENNRFHHRYNVEDSIIEDVDMTNIEEEMADVLTSFRTDNDEYPIVSKNRRRPSLRRQSVESMEENMIKKEPCIGCKSQRNQEFMTDEAIRQQRIEMIKEQILMKLRLKEPPTVTMTTSSLPRPLSEGIIPRYNFENMGIGKDVDDFFGKTEQVIIFPENVTTHCRTRNNDPVACFEFILPAEVHAEEVSTAQLWVYKQKDNNDKRNQSFVLSYARDVAADNNYINVPTSHITTLTVDMKDGWMKFDIARQMHKWLERRYLRRVIQVACKTCAMDPPESPVGSGSTFRPFIVINTSVFNKKSRTRRQINCSPGVTDCCRESLYISFKELGWASWILQPEGYHAYYCKGSCSAISSVTQSRLEHTAIMHRYTHAPGRSQRSNNNEFVPCCTPTQMTGISILYVNDTNVVQNYLPNMIVKSCGCM